MRTKGKVPIKAQLKSEAVEFQKAILKLGKKYNPHLSGQFALTKIPKNTSSKKIDSSRKVRRCVKWGIDPTNGKKICIRWE